MESKKRRLSNANIFSLISLTVIVVALVFGMNGRVSAVSDPKSHDFGGDIGSLDAYEISSVEDLLKFKELVDSNGGNINGYLSQNISFEDSSALSLETTIGTQDVPFVGKFDGCGYKILNLQIASNNNEGLFGVIGEEGLVQNVGLEGGRIKGKSRVGGIAGVNKGIIENCYNTSSVRGESDVGGIAGFNEGQIIYCYNANSVCGDMSVGGIAGVNKGIIENCYNTNSEIESADYAGGIVGYNQGQIIYCYNTSLVCGNRKVGGIAGENTATINNCFYNKDICDVKGIENYDVDGSAIGLATEQMTGNSLTYMANAFGTTNWIYTANTSAENLLSANEDDRKATVYYPQLKAFADTTAPSSSVVFTLQKNDSESVNYGDVYDFELLIKMSVDGGEEIPVRKGTATLSANSVELVTGSVYDTMLRKSLSFIYHTTDKKISGSTPISLSFSNIPFAQNTTDKPFMTLLVKAANYAITATAGAGGTISPSGNSVVEKGENQTFTITPTSGYSIESVMVDGASVGTVSSYTFDNVTANHTISVTFTYNGGTPVTNVTIEITTGTTETADPESTESKVAEAAKAIDGDTVKVDLENKSDKIIDKEIINNIKGKDVDLVINVGGGVEWVINGKDIPDDWDPININLSVKTGKENTEIPVLVIDELDNEKLTYVELEYDGEFGFTMTMKMNVGEEYADKYANLYFYNEKGELELLRSVKINADGTLYMPFSHASSYVISITDAPLTADNSDAEPEFESNDEQKGNENPTTGSSPSGVLAVTFISLTAVGITFKKRRK